MSATFLKGFASLLKQIEAVELEVQGQIPADISGTLFRNGPGVYDLDRYRLRHWFDGMAMLHKFDFANGRVCYSNRQLQTQAYLKALKNGELAYREFASEPHSTSLDQLLFLLHPTFSDNVAINVTVANNQFVAMSDSPLMVKFNPITMDILGQFKYDDKLDQGFISTPHPHYDFTNNCLINYHTSFTSMARSSVYNIYRMGLHSSTRQLIAAIPIPYPAYMHSFAITENYVVLVEFSLLLENPLQVALSDKPILDKYTWSPEHGTRFLVVHKKTGQVKIWQGEASFGFHHINAFEKGNDIFVDIASYPEPLYLHSLLLDRLLHSNGGNAPMGEFRRYHLPSNATHADYSYIAGTTEIEMPRINYKYNTQDYNFAYAQSRVRLLTPLTPASTSAEPPLYPQQTQAVSTDKGQVKQARSELRPNDFYNSLVKIDVKTQQLLGGHWHEPNRYPGEPIFVPKHDPQSEDDGYIFSLILDARENCSFLVILDAKEFPKEIARIKTPFAIPFGFHGGFFPRS